MDPKEYTAVSTMNSELELNLIDKSILKNKIKNLTLHEIDVLSEKLKISVIKQCDILIKNQSNGTKRREVMKEACKYLKCAISFAQVVLEENLSVSTTFLEMVIFLNGILFDIPNKLSKIQGNIVKLCETMCYLNYIENNEYIVYNTLIFLLKKTICMKSSKNDLNRLYNLRSLLPKMLTIEGINIDEVWDIFKKCSVSNLYNSTLKGQKIISLILTTDSERILDIHNVTKKKLPSCSKIQAMHYGRIYFDAWFHSVKTNNETLKNVIEIEIIQDFVLQIITSNYSSMINLSRKLLGQFFCNKKEVSVSKMLHGLLQPILWMYLKHPEGVKRARAAKVFLDVFPLEDPANRVVASEIEMNEQFLMIKDLLLDECPMVRSTTVTDLCSTLSIKWEIFSEQILKTYFKIIVNDLSCDSSSAEVREAVAKGIKVLLENPLIIPTLKTVLPNFQHLFHDVSDSVRIAFCQSLLYVKRINAIKYFDIIPLEHLLARLEEDPVIAKLIVKLLCNSYLPRNVPIAEVIFRSSKIIKMGPGAYRKFFQYVVHYNPLNELVIYICRTMDLIHNYVMSPVLPKHNFKPFQNSERLWRACSFHESKVVAGFMDAFAIIWLANLKMLKKPENKKLLKKVVGLFRKCLRDLLFFYQKKKDACLSVFHLASLLPPLKKCCLPSMLFERLKAVTDESDFELYSQFLICLINRNQVDGTLYVLKELIEVFFIDASPPTRHKICVKMFIFLIEDRVCQKKILTRQTGTLNEFLHLFNHIKIWMRGQQNRIIKEDDVAFIQNLFHALLVTSVLLNQNSKKNSSIKFLDDVVDWVQSSIFPSTGQKNLNYKKAQHKKTSASYEMLTINIIKDICTVIGDAAYLGYFNVKLCKYVEFALELIKRGVGTILLLHIFKLFYKHILFFAFLSTIHNQEKLPHKVADGFCNVLKNLCDDSFFNDVPNNDLQSVQYFICESLNCLHHHNTFKLSLANIIDFYIEIILASIQASLLQNWDSFEKKFESLSSYEIPKPCMFLISVILLKPKLFVYFLHFFHNYTAKEKKNIQIWTAYCIVLHHAAKIKKFSKNLQKEAHLLKQSLEKMLNELYPLSPNELHTLQELQCVEDDEQIGCENQKLCFQIHCHLEMKKLSDIIDKKKLVVQDESLFYFKNYSFIAFRHP